MKANKNTLTIFAVIFSLLIFFPSCSKKNESSATKKTIVCTIFPQYDWISSILGENSSFELSYLLTKGTDLHSYQPTVADLVKVSQADIFVYVGGESDLWVKNALHNVKNKNQIAVNMIELLGDYAREETEIPGAQIEELDDEDAEEGVEYDEHVWVSVKNAIFYTEAFTEIICQLDPENKLLYKKNAESYCKELSLLHKAYEELFDSVENPAILLGDRFPFLYFAEDYNLKYFAAFSGCSAETEASFSTIINLANILSEQNLSTVFILENSSPKLANQIIENSESKSCKVMILNSMQSVTDKDVKNGTSYLSLTKENLEALSLAFGK